MPSTYTHYRFGQQVVSLLPKEQKETIQKYKELFDIGLHGPDILFYYKPLSSNFVNQVGFGMHDEVAVNFFQTSGKKLLHKKDTGAYLSYLYGFICHFVLDSKCHGYIDEKIEESAVSHVEIEVEFDRMLMTQDGYKPLVHPLTEHIHPSIENATIIASFFEGISRDKVQKSLQSMKWYNKLILAPYLPKRCFIYALLAVSGNYKEMKGLIVNYKENPKCRDSNETLMRLYQNALIKAAELISEYETCICSNLQLSSDYWMTFGSRAANMDELANALASKVIT